MKSRMIAVLALAATLAACGGGSETGDTASFGQAADAADADREIAIQTTGELRFEPDSVEVEEGETISFVVTNDGTVEHEFVLGTPDSQEEMGASGGGMEQGGHEMWEGSVHVAPGETATLTWTFSEATDIQFACHVDNHYDAGMLGTVEFSS